MYAKVAPRTIAPGGCRMIHGWKALGAHGADGPLTNSRPIRGLGHRCGPAHPVAKEERNSSLGVLSFAPPFAFALVALALAFAR